MTNPRNVLIWHEIASWSQRVQDLMSDILTPAVIDAVRAEPPEYCDWEDPNWLQKALDIARVHTQMSAVDILAHRLPRAYPYIRAYHACRPTKVDRYYEQGFLPADAGSLNNLAERYFLRPPNITREILNRAIKVSEQGGRGGHVFFALDDRNLTANCSHYLKYGSEYIAVIAHELQRLTGQNCPAYLKTIGVPTIFVCDLPIVNVRSSALSGKLLECLFEEYVRPRGEAPIVDFTLTISVRLPPNIIVSHYHPKIREDDGN